MGVDRRGLWVDDQFTGTKIRLGEVSTNLAMTLAEQGNKQAVQEVMCKPYFGLWFSKEF